ncbi:SNF2 family N-terminal domain-containing protein [Fusarium venenatum]|uniref:SNF2 family N-terminal domain-containing protein n=1 Tax=Fusarium venenatum TaxID=56646 RepID=UPI001D5FAF79|nr:SNF2 family N-terminal domain-containing protein [Fusarium venenatum]
MSSTPHTSDAPDTGRPLLFAPPDANGVEGCTGLPMATPASTVTQPQPQDSAMEDSQSPVDQQLNATAETLEPGIKPEGDFESDTESATSDNDDSDYVDDEVSDSDSNDLLSPSNDSLSKQRDEVSLNIEAHLKELEVEKGKLVFLSQFTCLLEHQEERLEFLESEIYKEKEEQAALNTPTIEKPKRRRPIKNVREYFARKHGDEDKRAAKNANKKRKGSAKGGVRKKRKTTAKNNTIDEKGSAQKMDRIFDSTNDIEGAIAENSAPVMPGVHATTKKELLDHFKSSIPEGSDVRRVKTQARDLEEAWKMFGPRTITAAGDRCFMKGMNFGLLDYQLMALGWMMSREFGRTLLHGGILADAPGLGKAVTSLATIIGNPPDDDPDNTFCNATIIVVPNKDIVDQWYQEVRKHCQPPFSKWVMKYSRSRDTPLEQVEDQLIVITTYHTITQELPKKAVIKNNGTRVKLACCMLKGKYHWALTGTPLSNNLEEMFPYLQFTGCKFTRNIRDFKNKYIGEENNDNLETLISMIMLRRTNQDTFLGHKVLPLPKAHAHDIKVSLSVKETAIYDVIHWYYERIIGTMKRKLKNGGDSNLTQKIEKVKLARQLRLRQVTSHPFTIEKIIQEKLRGDGIVGIQREHNKAKGILPIVESLKDGDKGSHGLARFNLGMEHLEALEDEAFGGNLDMDDLLKLALNEVKIRGIACGLCKKAKPPVKPVRSANCEHLFCESCLIKALSHDKGGRLKTDVECPKDKCDAKLEFGERVDTLVDVQDRVKDDRHFTEPGRDINNARPLRKPCENGFFIASSLESSSITPSLKITTAMAVCAQ